jgi:mono/diheme cytochrome c family protein
VHSCTNSRFPFAVIRLLVIAALVFAFPASSFDRAEAKQTGSSAEMVTRGEYLVTTMGCNDCHTPWKLGPKGPEPDMTRMLSGHPEGMAMPAMPTLAMPWGWVGGMTMTAFGGPWGISFSRNLTPDMETGIGAWDESVFIAAMRNGKQMGVGRPILPPMPYMWYAKLTDEDLKSIFAYLQSIPPIRNRAPEPVAPAGAPTGH